MVRPVGKKKVCWNCEGDVPREAVNCPYCAVYLHPEEDNLSIEEDEDEDDLSPPYKIHTASENEESSLFPPSKDVAATNKERASSRFTIAFSGWKNTAVPLISLLFGTLFMLFAFLLFVFSQDGLLTLQWKSDLWPIYGAIALPLIFIGWKTLQAVDG